MNGFSRHADASAVAPSRVRLADCFIAALSFVKPAAIDTCVRSTSITSKTVTVTT